MHKFIFGVFRNGKPVILIGTKTTCTHQQAALVVAILDKASYVLVPGDYFAYDYAD